MGNRRMGLARMEALLEAVDRDLNLANSTLTNCTITTTAACVFTGDVTGAEGITNSAVITATSGTTWSSGAMSIPAGAIITDVGCVVTATLGLGSGVLGLKAGVTAGATNIAAAVANSLSTAVTSLAVGKGCNSVAIDTAAMGGNAIVPLAANAAYGAAARTIHCTLTAGDTITGGSVRFWVKYMTMA
tara:strand:+ start:1786 stop:2349 length:564 start_codon:yes stop_codon:yes gene_type:complete